MQKPELTRTDRSTGRLRVTPWSVAILSVALVTYSSTVHLLPAFNILYVPFNLVATAVLGVIAVRFGLGSGDLGLERTTARSGLTWGATVALLAFVVLGIGVAIPTLRPLFEDARLTDISLGLVAYRALIRIPLGTALFEEFAFRGVLFGAWAKLTSPVWAAVGSSVVFGLWHVRPTLDLLDANQLAMSAGSRAMALAAAVLFTAVGGYLFCLLRIRSRSLLAPFIAHAAINSLAIVAAAVAAS